MRARGLTPTWDGRFSWLRHVGNSHYDTDDSNYPQYIAGDGCPVWNFQLYTEEFPDPTNGGEMDAGRML
jgi:hypothetical protein